MHSLRLSRIRQPGSSVVGAILLVAVLILFGVYAEAHAAPADAQLALQTDVQ